MPIQPLGTFEPNRTSFAVQVSAEVSVMFELAKKRQDLIESPSVVARCGPLVEISRHSANSYCGVNRRAPPGDFAR